MPDEVDPQSDELLDEFDEDSENPPTVLCSFCFAENDALLLKSVQTNHCRKCGHLLGANDFIQPYDIRVGGSSHDPSRAQKGFIWIARLMVVCVAVWLLASLLQLVKEMSSLPIR